MSFISQFSQVVIAGASLAAQGSAARDMLVWFDVVLFLSRLAGRMDGYLAYAESHYDGNTSAKISEARAQLRPGLEQLDAVLNTWVTACRRNLAETMAKVQVPPFGSRQ